jgi:hypothetical protein
MSMADDTPDHHTAARELDRRPIEIYSVAQRMRFTEMMLVSAIGGVCISGLSICAVAQSHSLNPLGSVVGVALFPAALSVIFSVRLLALRRKYHRIGGKLS